MLEMLHLKNVGPAPEMKLEFGSRLNVITGDNGLGKSFILDCAWFGLTKRFLKPMNPKMQYGEMPRPRSKELASLTFRTNEEVTYTFSAISQSWSGSTTEIPQAIVVQSLPENEFGIFDPLRTEFSETFGFSTSEIWDGLKSSRLTWNGSSKETLLCNGLIHDLAFWQLENGTAISFLEAALEVFSPPSEPLTLGKTTRVKIEDVRDIPTLKMPYGSEVPVTQASSGIKRIVTLAYVLVWAWQEHLRAAELKQTVPIQKLVFLLDEIENHLHPQWQRTIVQSLLNVAKALSDELEVQIILTTHSPLVMASLEPFFDPKQDAWFDLNLVDGEVKLEKMNFVKRGEAGMWLLSDAFDLQSTGSKQREEAIARAARAIEDPKLTKKKFLIHDKELRNLLSDTDEYWLNWRFYGERKGWL
jgi:hypothetical protein